MQFSRFIGGSFIVLFFLLFIGTWYILPRPLFRPVYSTVLQDRDGETMGITVAGDGQFRFQEVQQLPEKYVTAVMAFEDKRYMLHTGVDFFSLARAFYQNIKARQVVSGGSTLSMQVVRLALGNPPRTVKEKIREILLTFCLEQQYSKGQILSFYASHAPFGGNIVGIRAAALKYFNREPEQLSWGEAALLAVLPNAPALIFPGRNNASLKQKRDLLLKKLCESGIIHEDDYKLAIAEPLPVKFYEVSCPAPHLLMRAYKERKGQICHSFIDRRLQLRVNEIVDRHMALLSRNYIYNAAVLVIHVKTGEVRAYAGNSKAMPGSRGNEVDIISSVRSSGSILKPLLYAEMLQNGFILPGTLIPDIPSRFGGYAPSNFNRDFQGAVPASRALAQSLNIPFVRMLRDYSYVRFYEDLKQVGITSLVRPADHYGLSLILGGAETSLWDLGKMYTGMASVLGHYAEEDGQYFEGEYNKLKLWASGAEEQSVIERRTAPLKASAVWLTFKALQEVERPEMESGWKNFASSMDLAWKTGTSFGFRDAWAVGMNSDYVIGVWVGNADGEGRPGLVGVRAAAPILFEVAALLPATQPFYAPEEELVSVAVCRKSGHRVSPVCVETDTVQICEAGLRTTVCPYHRLVGLDDSHTWQVNAECESVYRIQMVPWFILPPVQEWYYCRTHSDYRKLPPFRQDCRATAGEMMEMIYPQRGTRVFIPKDFGGREEQVVLEAVHRLPAASVYWHIDGQYWGTTQSVHQMKVNLSEGKHILVLVDQAGNTLRQVFEVVGKNPHTSVVL